MIVSARNPGDVIEVVPAIERGCEQRCWRIAGVTWRLHIVFFQQRQKIDPTRRLLWWRGLLHAFGPLQRFECDDVVHERMGGSELFMRVRDLSRILVHGEWLHPRVEIRSACQTLVRARARAERADCFRDGHVDGDR